MGGTQPEPVEDGARVYIARQPILDRAQKTCAYELLFRSGGKNSFDPSVEGSAASLAVIKTALFDIGLEKLTDGKLAFVNFTRSLLSLDIAGVLPPANFVIELLEDIPAEEDVVAACARLKKAGYKLALDDFWSDDLDNPLIRTADVVKVDFMQADPARRAKIASGLIPRGIQLLAEKVETGQEFLAAKEWGYSYFQGYFFSKPEMLSSKKVESGGSLHVRLLQELASPAFDMDRAIEVIRWDPVLAYEILKYANSPLFAATEKITGLTDSLLYLGLRRVKNCLRVFALSSLGKNKPQEQILQAVFRARFCELMASKFRQAAHSEEYFTVGLFSMIDAITDEPKESVLKNLHLSDEIVGAVLGTSSCSMSLSLRLAIAYQSGQWDVVDSLVQEAGLGGHIPPAVYRGALQWSDSLLGSL